MCNINVLIRKDGKNSRDLTECMNIISYNSFLKNSHAEGFVDETFKVHKAVHKIIYTGEHNLLISHQRIATSGHNEEMAQPIELGNFIILHNGVISGLGDDKFSDTYKFLEMINTKYEELKDTVKSIQEVTKECSGSFSVVLYNKKTKELYYFKEYNTNMYLIDSKDYLIMSTIKENVEFCQKYFELFKDDIVELDPYQIVNLRDMMCMGKFSKKEYVYQYSKGGSKNSQSSTGYSKSSWNKSDTRDNIEKLLILYGFNPISIGVGGKITTIGLKADESEEFANKFPKAEFVKSKKNKDLFNVSTKDLIDEYEYEKRINIPNTGTNPYDKLTKSYFG